MVSTTGTRTRNKGQARTGRSQASRVSPETEKSKKRKNDKNDNDDDGSVGSVQILEPKTFPKAYGDKPTFRDYLQKLPAAQRNKVLHEIIESLEKDKDGSPKVELAQLLMARPVACLVMSKKSAYPMLAHNMFYFAASVRDKDENHMIVSNFPALVYS